MAKEGGLRFYSVMVAYGFDVKVRHCGFCKDYDSLGVFWYLRFCFGKVINVFFFLELKKKKKKHSN